MLCILAGTSSPALPVEEWDKLFFDPSVFPSGWKKGEISEACISAPLDSGCDNFQAKWIQYYNYEQDRAIADRDQAIVEIKFYESVEAATSDYQEVFDLVFYQYSTISEYRKPIEISFQSFSAESYDYGCSIVDERDKENCKFLAQYGQFIVDASVWLDENSDYSIFLIVMEAIDETLAFYETQPPYYSSE